MNPIASRVPAKQAGPQRYNPSPIRTGGKGPENNAYLEYD